MLRIERSHDEGVGPTLTLRLDGDSGPTTATVRLPSLAVSTWEQESIRWFLEDFRLFPADPAPAVAAAAAALIERLGGALFEALFTTTPEGRALWATARGGLADLDWEIDADLAGDVPVPFEMLREPGTGVRPALVARSFTQVVRRPSAAEPVTLSGPLRVLLVVARPQADLDVPFRSIAGRLVRHAAEHGPHIDVLRPPTFEALTERLRRAAAAGEAYQLVHFDGHGLFGPVEGEPEGYAVFEDPDRHGNQRLVSGTRLGEELAANGVRALVLNACRSGRSDSSPAGTVYASLARRCVDAGLTAVVAMRYDIYVSTATAFVARLYDLLFQGRSLPDAVLAARAGLASDTVHGEWLVPVILQSATVSVEPSAAALVPAPTAATGFVGRDDLTITIDRTFDTGPAVLLWGAAGVGKSALAADFAAWYRTSRGVDGPAVVWRLDGDRAALLAGIASRAALREPAIWVWESLESTASWPDADRQVLAGIVAGLADGPVKLLLTGRERASWLPGTVRRIQVRPLSSAEGDELAGSADVWTAAYRDFCGGYPEVIRWAVESRPVLPPIGDRPPEAVAARSAAASAHLAGLSPEQRSTMCLVLPFRAVVSAYHLTRMREFMGLPRVAYAAVAAVLDEVADLGWLTRLDAEHYALHPYLRAALYRLAGDTGQAPEDIEQAFGRCFRDFGHGLFWSYSFGNPAVLDIIALEEPELLHSFELALAADRADDVFGPLQALRMLYERRHRDDEWYALAARLAPGLLDPRSLVPRADVALADASLHGLLLDYAGALARHRADPVAYEAVASALRAFAESLDGTDRGLRTVGLRSQAVRLLRSSAIDDLRQGLDLAHRVGDTALEISALVDLSHAYRHDGDFERAELCLDEAFALVPESDTRHYVRILDAFGALRLRQFDSLADADARRLGRQLADAGHVGRFEVPITAEQLPFLRSAYAYYTAALRRQPDADPASVASLHHQLAGIAGKFALWADADAHYRMAIAGHDQAGDLLRGAQSRGDFANHLVHRGERYAEALLYARAAYADLLTLDEVPDELLERARDLVAELAEKA
ncbi:CHAT domain-containing protein [Hamadaea tsunoensis]|uniref:CHAT domain-containing protein n=1 Tax=Hamadaea tsunoensis TaxID=53368 RepID=UPI00040ED404|nr:CHAT domain-containing protein [Hamadaea tsunoensis]